jgi:putative NIF3 family GTP cyclohydrolase 1 type 2
MKEMLASHNELAIGRKKFIYNFLTVTGGLALFPSIMANPPALLTVQQVIDLILKQVPGAPFKDTVDTIKAGNPDQPVTGIVTTMFATIDIIKEAANRKANFIIAHEPTFYNHRDDKNWVANNDIVAKKAALLDQHKIAVWRFHDYCHALQPDAISYGVAKKAGWLSYYKPGEVLLEIPAITLQQLVMQLKKALSIEQVRLIGNPGQTCKRIALLPGAWGGQRQVTAVLKEKPDVLIVGESSEWETVEFIRDGKLLGSNTALLVLGHAVSEEPGMEWVADWLQPMLGGIRVSHIASKDPFTRM